jgi:hypothetical protein
VTAIDLLISWWAVPAGAVGAVRALTFSGVWPPNLIFHWTTNFVAPDP